MLSKYGFKSLLNSYQPIELLEIMKKDKKAEQEKIIFIVPCEKKEVREIKLTSEEVLKMF